MIKKLLYLLIAGSLLVACKQNNTGGEVKKADTTQTIAKDTVKLGQEVAKVASELPSPVDFIAHINQAKLEYNAKYLNNPENVNAYLSTSQRSAINLGVYLVDLGYNSLYMKAQEGLKFLKSVKKLTDQLNILDEQTKEMVVKFEKNLENRDSLLTIAREGYFSIDEYLRKNERADVASNVLIGAWVEGLYLGTSLLKEVPNYDKEERYKLALWRIGGQKTSLENIINMVGKMEQNDENKQLLTKLKELYKAYESVKVESASNDIDVLDIAEVQNADEISDKVLVKTTKRVEISKEAFEQIHAKVSDLRSFLVRK
ncbi:MAG: hypothetical protein RMJ97_00100 [Raineya sp.]|nr:hypothetical protein [Raineya sp.]MDW8295261.1 hypothetical protein [Raineya sp.]